MRVLALAALVFAAPASAQHDHTAPSGASGVLEAYVVDGLRVGDAPPPGSGVGRAGLRFADGSAISVVHGQPFARGRTVFGGLVGWGQVWSVGAHRATELWTSVALTVGGTRLAPGGYSLLATPSKRAWQIHINRRLGSHLVDEYDPNENVVTVEVPAETLDAPQEALRLSFEHDGDALGLRIAWDRTGVVLPLHRADR